MSFPSAIAEPAPLTEPVAQVDWRHALAEHGRWLRTIVIARLCEPQGVDDVLQEVALAAVRQAAPLKDPAKVAPWLYRLAVTHCLLYRRAHGRRRKLAERYTRACPLRDDDPRAPDPLEWLLSHERQEMIRKALSRLPRRDRELLLLKYTEDWSYHEIAQHLGMSHAAVESRLHRARAKLRSVLAELQIA